MERCITIKVSKTRDYLGDEIIFHVKSGFKKLKANNLIKRKEYEQLPPKVEYSLTERVKSLIPLLDGLCQWGEDHKI